MSKASLARELVALGHGKFNTLRKLDWDTLESMVRRTKEAANSVESAPNSVESALNEPAELLVPGSDIDVVTTIAPQVPSDESIIRAALKPMPEPVPTAQHAGSRRAWLALAMLPLDVLRAIVGTTPLCILGF